MILLTTREWVAARNALHATLAGVLDGFDEDTPEYEEELLARQSAMQKIEDAIPHLFEHDVQAAVADCPGCERTIRMTKAGTYQRHKVRSLGLLCPASGMTPAGARDADLWGLHGR